MIASKKGTTEAGINSLKSNNVLQLFEKGIISAVKRSKEISNEY
jgi:pyrroline-5-carboxylate reductase